MVSIKPSYNPNRIVLGEQLPLDTPLAVILDASERCNFRCSYCFRGGQQDESWGFAASGELMPPEIFALAVEQLKDFPQKIKLVSLSAQGEPLCNPHLAEMAAYLKEQGVTERIDMHTNASLLTEKSAIQIGEAGFSRIVVSLQGLDAMAYEQISKVKIDFERFYNHLKLLYENKNEDMKIHIKIVEEALDAADPKKNEQRFYELFGSIADDVYVEKIVPLWKNMDISADAKINKYGYTIDEVDYCPLLFYKILVAPDGEIYPCTHIPSPMSLGNIRDITLQEAWNSQKRLNFLKEHLLLTRHKHAACAGCFVPINSVTSSKDVIDPYRHTILRRLEEILSNE